MRRVVLSQAHGDQFAVTAVHTRDTLPDGTPATAHLLIESCCDSATIDDKDSVRALRDLLDAWLESLRQKETR